MTGRQSCLTEYSAAMMRHELRNYFNLHRLTIWRVHKKTLSAQKLSQDRTAGRGETNYSGIGNFQIYLCIVSTGRGQKNFRYPKIQFCPRLLCSSHVFMDVSITVTQKENYLMIFFYRIHTEYVRVLNELTNRLKT